MAPDEGSTGLGLEGQFEEDPMGFVQERRRQPISDSIGETLLLNQYAFGDFASLFQSLFESNRRLVETNERMTYELRKMRGAVQLQLELPPQVTLQKPVTLLDACGKVSAFHLDFINCAEAFLAVLKIRFKQHGIEERGLKMLDDSQFVLEDFRGRLDLTKPWSQIMRPNQKVDMSMIFQRGVPWSVCPGCMNENDVAFESAIEWYVI
ncbi:MAG: hypothetical protein Q9181_001006 [Wetmoreana brouardii]